MKKISYLVISSWYNKRGSQLQWLWPWSNDCIIKKHKMIEVCPDKDKKNSKTMSLKVVAFGGLKLLKYVFR